MIFQIFFTLAAELVALAVGMALILLAARYRGVLKWLSQFVGAFVILASIVLIVMTCQRMFNYSGQDVLPNNKKPKLQMQVLPTGPAVGGHLKDPSKFDNKPVEINP